MTCDEGSFVRLLYHSTLGARVINKKREVNDLLQVQLPSPGSKVWALGLGCEVQTSGSGLRVWGLGLMNCFSFSLQI